MICYEILPLETKCFAFGMNGKLSLISVRHVLEICPTSYVLFAGLSTCNWIKAFSTIGTNIIKRLRPRDTG